MTGLLESYSVFNYYGQISYSEQNLIDCVDIGDCNGGFPELGLVYFLNTGLMYTSQYSNYTGQVTIYYFSNRLINTLIYFILNLVERNL